MIFENTAKCLACGKEKFVNTSGFCEKCWITHAHLREGKRENEDRRRADANVLGYEI